MIEAKPYPKLFWIHFVSEHRPKLPENYFIETKECFVCLVSALDLKAATTKIQEHYEDAIVTQHRQVSDTWRPVGYPKIKVYSK